MEGMKVLMGWERYRLADDVFSGHEIALVDPSVHLLLVHFDFD